MEVGEGVTSLKPGDHVIPLYTRNADNASIAQVVKPICVRRSAQHKEKD